MLTPHSTLVDIIENFRISLWMEQTHVPEKQQEPSVHSHCWQWKWSCWTDQLLWGNSLEEPRSLYSGQVSEIIRRAEVDPLQDPLLAQQAGWGPGSLQGSCVDQNPANCRVSSIWRYLLTKRYRKIMFLEGGEWREWGKQFLRQVVFSLQENSVNNLNFWVKLAFLEHVMLSHCGHSTA